MINFRHLILNLTTRLIREMTGNNWILKIELFQKKYQKFSD